MEQNDRAQSAEEIVRRIDEIKARCDRATPGAWRDVERGNSVISHGVVTVAYDGLPQQNVCAGISPKTGNATFIAHAREDIPYLLQLVEAQAAEIAELRDEVGSMRRCDESNRQIYLNLRSRLSKRDREIIKLKLEKELMRQEWETAMAQLTASQQRERAAVEFIRHLDREYSHYIADRGFEQWRGPQEAGKGENKMTKLEALNALEVSDHSSSCGEVEYILADLTTANIKTLLDAGFTAEQIDEAMGDDKTDIELSTLAFQHADAAWWSSEGGFVAQAGEGEQ